MHRHSQTTKYLKTSFACCIEIGWLRSSFSLHPFRALPVGNLNKIEYIQEYILFFSFVCGCSSGIFHGIFQ